MDDPFSDVTRMGPGDPLQPGIMVFERFVLERRLGRGGMGEVWLAQDNLLGGMRALKFLPPELSADDSADLFA